MDFFFEEREEVFEMREGDFGMNDKVCKIMNCEVEVDV